MGSSELACVYAALILNDNEFEITSDKINSILNAAGVKVETYWIDLFGEYFKLHDLSELIKGIPLGSTSTSIDKPDDNIKTLIENQNDEKKEEEIEIDGGFSDLFNF